MPTDCCPVCGGPAVHHASDEGTHSVTARPELPGGSYMDDALMLAERRMREAVEILDAMRYKALDACKDGAWAVDAEWVAMGTSRVSDLLSDWLATVGDEVQQLRD